MKKLYPFFVVFFTAITTLSAQTPELSDNSLTVSANILPHAFIEPNAPVPEPLWAPPPPSNDNVANATDVTSLIDASCTSGGTYTTKHATPDQSAPACWTSGLSNNVWFKFRASSTGAINLTVLVDQSGETMKYAMVAILDGSLNPIGCVNANGAPTFDPCLGISGLTPGSTYYIEVDDGGDADAGKFDLCLSDNALATISYGGSPYCATGSATVTQTGQAGGTYSSTAGLAIDPTLGTIDLGASTAGTYTVTYSFTNGSCSDQALTKVIINPTPQATISYAPGSYFATSTFCATGTAAVTLSGQSGGTFSSTSGLVINPSSGSINLVTSNPGSYTVTYVVSNGTCTTTTTTNMSIVALPQATISYSGSPFCATGTAAVTQTGQGGGTYSSTTGLSINAATGAINLAGSTPGNYTITYSYTNGTCNNTATATITINPVPTASISYAANPYVASASFCAAGTAAVTETGQTGGTFSSTAGLSINSSSGTINLGVSTPGTYTVTYTFSNGSCSNTATTTVTINPLPTAAIAYNGSPYCATGVATVTQTGQAGGTYSANSGLSIDGTTGTVNLGTSAPGTYTVTYSFSNGTCSNTTTTTITVINSVATAVISYNGNPFCAAGMATVNLTGQGGGNYSSTAGLVIDPVSGTINLGTSTPGTYTVTYTFSNGACSNSSSTTTTVTINALPTAAIAYAGGPYCATGTASVTQTGQTGGTYSSTSGLNINASTGTINLGTSSAGTYTVTYSFSNGTCINATSTTVTINALPTATISYTPNPYYAPGIFCQTGTAAVTLTGQSGGTYSSTTGLSIDPVSGTIDLGGSAPGTYTVNYAFTNGSCSGSTTTSLTITALPTATIAYTGSPYCATGTATVTQTGQTGGTYSSTTGLALNASTGAINLGSSAAGTYTITYTFTNGPCTSTTTTSVTINPLPTATISYASGPTYSSTSYCNYGTATVTQTGQTGGAYTSTSGLSLDPVSGSINLATSTPGAYTVTYAFSNGSCNGSTTATLTIVSSPTVITNNPAPVCPPSTIDLTAAAVTAGSTSGLTFTYYTDPGATTPLASPNAVTSPATYYIEGTNASACYAIAPVTVTFNPQPTAAITYAGSPYCATGTAGITQTGQTGGIYSSTAGISLNTNTGAVDLGSSAPGTYTVTYTFTNGTCTNTTTTSITIQSLPSATIAYSGSPYCSTGTAAVTQTGQTGGTYSSTTGLTIDPAAGTIDLGASTPGTYVVTYSFGNGTCNNTATTTVTINPTPTASIAYTGSPYCATGSAAVTQTGQTGGSYSSTAGLSIDASTGTINLATSTPGIYTVTYSFTNGTCSTPSTTTAQVTILSVPTAGISYPGTPYCAAGLVTVNQTGQTGGTYSAPTGLTIDPSSGTVNAATSTPGTYTVVYTFSNGACSASANTSITILNPTPTAAISYSGSPYCATGTATVTQTGQTGGTYSSTAGLTIDATSGAVNLSTSTAGTYTVTYAFGSGACSSSTTASITINALPTLITNNPAAVCPPSTVDLTAAAVTAGSSSGLTFGYYTNAATTSTLSNPSAVGASGTYYIKGADGNSCSAVAPVTVTINALPSATISYPGNPFCISGTAPVNQTGQPGGTYSSGSGLSIDPSTGTIDLTSSTPGTYTVTYTFSNGTCTNTATTSVTINPLPTATISYPGSPYCATGAAAVTLTGTTGGSYSSTTGLSINSATGTIDLTSSTPGTYTVTYTFGNGTCTNSTTTSVTIIAAPTLVITDPAAVCSPATVDLTAASVTAGSSTGITLSYYTDAGATSTLSNPNAVGSGGTYYIEATNSNSCSVIKPVVVMVKTPPTATVSYPGSPYCATGTATVTQTGQTGGTYSSTTGLVIDASTGAINLTASTPGIYTVTYTYTNGTCGNTATAGVAINAAPTVTITNPAPVCAPATIDLTAAAVTAGSSTGLTFGYYTNAAATNTLANPNAVATAGTYYIQGTDANSCSTVQPVTVTFNPMPTATIAYPNSPYCTTGTAAVTQTGQTGGSYGSTVGLSIDASTGAIDLAATTPGTYTVTYTFSNGSCSGSTTASVTINALPTASISYPGTPFCGYGVATVTQTGTTGGSYSSTTGLSIDGSAGTINLGASTPGTYTVTYTFTNGSCSNTATTLVTISAPPTATISYNGTPYCATDTAAVTQTGQTGGFYSSAAGLIINASTGTINLATSTPGTYTVTYTFTNGICNNIATTTVTIDALATASITYAANPYYTSASFCPTGTALVNLTGQEGGTFSAATGLSIDPATGTINLAASTPGTYTVSYSYTSPPCGLLSTTTTTVVINPLPTATISYTGNPYCASGSATVTQTGQTGGTYSSTTGLTIDPTTGTITLSTSTPGTYLVTYTFSNGSCNNTATANVTVNALPPATISYTGSPFCAYGMGTVTESGLTGGTFGSTAGLMLNPATGTINLATSTAGTYTVTYTVSNGTCVNAVPATVAINALPTATISYTGSPFCPSGTANVNRTGQAGGTYSSTTGLAIDPSTGSIDLGASSPGTYTVSYSYTNGICNNTSTTSVIVKALPAATISYSPSSFYASSPFCSVGTANVTLTGTGGGTFSSTPGLSINASTGTINLGASTPGTYTVTYSFTNGSCSNAASTSITIMTAVSPATISYPGTPYCAQGIANVTLTGTTTGTFTAPSGLSIDPVSGTINLGLSAPGTYTVTYSWSNGTCSSNSTATVTVVALASASIRYSSSPYSVSASFCASGSAPVILTGQTGGTFSSTPGLAIDPSTGAINLGASTAGTYTVTYSFTNGNCSNASTTTANVTIIPIPAATISYPASPYCATGSTPVIMTGTTGGTFSSTAGLAIDPSTGTIDLGSSMGGTYTVTYAFSNGTCDNAVTTTVTVHALPTATISYAPSPYYATSIYCSLGTAFVTQTGQTGGTYSSTSGLSLDPVSGQINLAATTPGTYTVTYTFNDGICGNTTTTNVTIVAVTAPAAISYPSSPYCGNGKATVTQTGQGGGYYTSTPGLSLDLATGAVNVSASTPGIYTVTYTFNDGTCVGNTSTTIQINTQPVVKITQPAPVCAPGTIDLTDASITAGSDPGLTYQYYTDQAGDNAVANPSAVATTGIYFIEGSNTGSCKSQPMAVTAVVSNKPVINAGGDSVICIGTTANLHASSPGDSLEWIGLQETSGNVVVQPDVTTTYLVAATNNSGCSDTVSLPVRVLDFKLTLTANPDPIVAGYDLTLTTSSDSAYTVTSWWPQTVFAEQQSPSQTFLAVDSSQLYMVYAKSSWGCIDSAQVEAQINTNTKDFYIPNAFTPNGDGQNDIFKAYGVSIRSIDLKVFNQWGQLLYETLDPAQGWDGTFNGKNQPTTVYIYVVRAVLYGGKVIQKRGTVDLIR
jgi:gliding motility-associated-like protein